MAMTISSIGTKAHIYGESGEKMWLCDTFPVKVKEKWFEYIKIDAQLFNTAYTSKQSHSIHVFREITTEL